MPHKLLLADDSVTIQRVIELTFADEDVLVTAVGNGQEAIDRVQRDRPDIILADVGMPERNGYEVAAFVKGNPSTAHIPVVLLTGAFEPVDEGRARAVGCDGVLVKPFEPQIVISRVKDLLAGRAPTGMWNAPAAAPGPVRHPSADMDLRGAAPAAAPPSDPLEAYFDRLDAAFASTGSSTPSDPFAGLAPASNGTARETIPLSRRPVPGEAPPAGGDPFADWDPDLKGDPAAAAPPPAAPAAKKIPVATPPAPPLPQPEASTPAPPAPPSSTPAAPQAAASTAQPPASAPSAAPPPAAPAPLPASLVDAFAALLAAEQKIGVTPSAAPAPSAPPAAGAPAPEPLVITDELIDEISSRVLARLSAEARPSILDVAERLVRDEIERIKKFA